MNLQRLTIKFFVQDAAALQLSQVIPVFHRWIQTQAVYGLLLDVTDYKHVPQGPGVILIGHEVDYALDLEGGEPGLLLRRKRPTANQTIAEQLMEAIAWARHAYLLLEQEPSWTRPLRFRTDLVELSFPDRRLAPNTPENWAKWESVVAAALQPFFPTAHLHLTRLHPEPQRLLGYRVTIQAGEA